MWFTRIATSSEPQHHCSPEVLDAMQITTKLVPVLRRAHQQAPFFSRGKAMSCQPLRLLSRVRSMPGLPGIAGSGLHCQLCATGRHGHAGTFRDNVQGCVHVPHDVGTRGRSTGSREQCCLHAERPGRAPAKKVAASAAGPSGASRTPRQMTMGTLAATQNMFARSDNDVNCRLFNVHTMP